MSCRRCASDEQKNFNGELAMHFPGWEGLNRPHVFVFPKLTVCLGCGFVEFVLSDEQREQLTTGGAPVQSCG